MTAVPPEIKIVKLNRPKIAHHILCKKGALIVGSKSSELIPLLVGKADRKKIIKIQKFGFNINDLDELIHPIP